LASNVQDDRRRALFRELAQLRDLPPAPRTLGAIWEVLGAESSSASALADVLQRDPALCAKVLRLTNSAYFGLPRPVVEVRAACVVLGFETIRALAVGVTTLDALGRGVGRALDLDAFWRHAVGVATAAQALVRRAGLPDAGSAFCAGILHDVGKLVLATLSPRRFGSLDAAAQGSWLAAEAAEFGADHAEVGSWLADRWHFPEPIRAAVAAHHQPASAAGAWGALIRLADGIAHRGGCPGPAGGTPAAADPALLAQVPIEPADLGAAEAGFASSLQRVAAFAEAARGA